MGNGCYYEGEREGSVIVLYYMRGGQAVVMAGDPLSGVKRTDRSIILKQRDEGMRVYHVRRGGSELADLPGVSRGWVMVLL